MSAPRSSEFPPSKPRSALAAGDVSFLEVVALIPKGALVDAGLERPLLVPRAEQTFAPEVGSRQPIALYETARGELGGTMKVSERLRQPDGEFELDQWVEGEAYRNDPDFGLFVIVERAFIGLVPASEPHGLSRGEAARFRVTSLLEDGRIELSLRDHAHQEIDRDADVILEELGRKPAPKVGDHSSPEQIRQLFRMSKKAFKRAVGRLLKRSEVSLDPQTGVLQLASPSQGTAPRSAESHAPRNAPTQGVRANAARPTSGRPEARQPPRSTQPNRPPTRRPLPRKK